MQEAAVPERIDTTARETDAFSHRSRSLISWAPGELKKLKRAYAKRLRKVARQKPEPEKPE